MTSLVTNSSSPKTPSLESVVPSSPKSLAQLPSVTESLASLARGSGSDLLTSSPVSILSSTSPSPKSNSSSVSSLESPISSLRDLAVEDASESSPSPSPTPPSITQEMVYTSYFDQKEPSHLQISIDGSNSNTSPAYVNQILSGHADELLNDADMEYQSQYENWGKGDLAHLGECSCMTLSRTKNAHVRLAFDKEVQTVFKDVTANMPQVNVTFFASGNLFDSYVHVVQMIDILKKQFNHAELTINIVDICYADSLNHELHDDSESTKAICTFRDEIAKILPENMRVSINVFDSASSYVNACEDPTIKPEILIGVDLADAADDWNAIKRRAAYIGEKMHSCALHKVYDPELPEELSALALGKPVIQIDYPDGRKSMQSLHARSTVEKPSEKSSTTEKVEEKESAA